MGGVCQMSANMDLYLSALGTHQNLPACLQELHQLHNVGVAGSESFHFQLAAAGTVSGGATISHHIPIAGGGCLSVLQHSSVIPSPSTYAYRGCSGNVLPRTKRTMEL